MKTKKTGAGHAVPLLAAAIALGSIVGLQAMGTKPQQVLSEVEKSRLMVSELKVDGMTCGGCEKAVEISLGKDAGVVTVEASYKKGNAIVTYDPDKTNPKKLAKLITEKSGYKAQVTKKDVPRVSNSESQNE